MTAAGAAAAVAETTIRSVRRTASAFVGRRATAAFAVWTVAALPVGFVMTERRVLKRDNAFVCRIARGNPVGMTVARALAGRAMTRIWCATTG